MSDNLEIRQHVKNVLGKIKERNIVTKAKVKTGPVKQKPGVVLSIEQRVVLSAAFNDIDVRKGGKEYNERLDIFTGRKFVVAKPEIYDECVRLGFIHNGKITLAGRAVLNGTDDSPQN